MREAEKF